jgi:hypothetical protein
MDTISFSSKLTFMVIFKSKKKNHFRDSDSLVPSMSRKKEISKKLRDWRACNYEITNFGGMMLTPGYLHSTIIVEFGWIGLLFLCRCPNLLDRASFDSLCHWQGDFLCSSWGLSSLLVLARMGATTPSLLVLEWAGFCFQIY